MKLNGQDENGVVHNAAMKPTDVNYGLTRCQRTFVWKSYSGVPQPFPRGVRDSPERYDEKSVKYRLVVHAESNAILNANKSVRECSLLVTKHPCSGCAKQIVQSGITDVFCPIPSTDHPWAEDAEFAKIILSEADVEINHITI